MVSEGFDVGELGEVKDSFGHTMFSSSQMTVAQAVVNYLNKVGLAAKGAARGNVPGTDQRHAMAYASTVDLEEAYSSGQMAAAVGRPGPERLHVDDPAQAGPIYSVRYDKVPLAEVANSERTFPAEWIAHRRLRRDRRFRSLRQAAGGRRHGQLPLVDGRQRLTRFQPIYAEQKLPAYVPQADRKTVIVDAANICNRSSQ